MTKTDKEVVYDSIKSALELVAIRVEDGGSENQMNVNVNGLQATLTLNYK